MHDEYLKKVYTKSTKVVTFASQIRTKCDTYVFPEQLQHLLETFIHRELTSFQYEVWAVRGLITWVNSSETWTVDVKKTEHYKDIKDNNPCATYRTAWQRLIARSVECFIFTWRRHYERTFNFSSPGLLVKTFNIPFLAHLERSMNEHFKKRQSGTCVDLPRLLPILCENKMRQSHYGEQEPVGDWTGLFFSFPTLLKGEMKLVTHTRPASANSLATSAIRRMFSSRSSAEKPRFLFRPWRTLSPSRE